MEPGVRALIGVSTRNRRKPKTSSDFSIFVNLGVGKSWDECLLKAKGLGGRSRAGPTEQLRAKTDLGGHGGHGGARAAFGAELPVGPYVRLPPTTGPRGARSRVSPATLRLCDPEMPARLIGAPIFIR